MKQSSPRDKYLKGLKTFNESQKREIVEFSECERILGNTSKVSAFGQFWEKHNDDFLTIGAKELFDFSTMQEYSRDELAAYRLGLGAIGKFFEKCFMEVQAKKQKAKLEAEQNSSQVSEESEI